MLRGRRFWVWVQGGAAVAAFGLAVGGVALRTVPEQRNTTSIQCLVPGGERVLVILTGDGAVVTMVREPDGDLAVGGERCVGANLDRVDGIRAGGDPGSQSVTLDLAGGPFGPGASPEGEGNPEVEMEISLGAGEDRLTVRGSVQRDTIALGTGGLNLNADEGVPDLDVTLADVEDLSVWGGEGSDLITAGGLFGTGDPLVPSVEIDGGLGDDELVGGEGADVVRGSAAADTLSGGPGDDELLGGQGDDLLDGVDGDDLLDGGEGGTTSPVVLEPTMSGEGPARTATPSGSRGSTVPTPSREAAAPIWSTTTADEGR